MVPCCSMLLHWNLPFPPQIIKYSLWSWFYASLPPFFSLQTFSLIHRKHPALPFVSHLHSQDLTNSFPLSLMLSRMAFISKKMIYLTSQAFNSFFFSSPLNISFGQRKFVPQRIKQARKTLFSSIAVGIKIFFNWVKRLNSSPSKQNTGEFLSLGWAVEKALEDNGIWEHWSMWLGHRYLLIGTYGS